MAQITLIIDQVENKKYVGNIPAEKLKLLLKFFDSMIEENLIEPSPTDDEEDAALLHAINTGRTNE
jgi:hypothetical protein